MMTFCCSHENDLYTVLTLNGLVYSRFDTPEKAIQEAPDGSAVLILADSYPEEPTHVADWTAVSEKRLRIYIEYPEGVPGVCAETVRDTSWERVIVASDAFGSSLEPLAILSVSGCHYVPLTAEDPWLVTGRVAGFDKAVFGIPDNAGAILFEAPDGNTLVATTKLSGFVSGRYGPSDAWKTVWEAILAWLVPGVPPPHFDWVPSVRPAFSAAESLPPDVERQALRNAAEWVFQSRLLIDPQRSDEVTRLLLSGSEESPAPPADAPPGDGSMGILEGYSSAIRHDGSQLQRLPIRADCQAETAMVLAMDAEVNGGSLSGQTARNLLDFLYMRSGMQGGSRGDPAHPAYGLIAWGAIAPAWEIANYGDDNARALLATMLAASCLGSTAWDAAMLRALLANLRTTGKLGFRGNRIDMPDLESLGWRSYAEAETVNPAPHYEAYLWACYLWAFRQTGHRPFLHSAEAGIRRTMEVYPDGWLFNDTSERGQMLLPLAWLVRVSDTVEHQAWLRRVVADLIDVQAPCGALPERFLSQDTGYYRIPTSNDEYGVTETPLIQANGDPASDQLYTSGMALLGLHEAASATSDPDIRDAEDRLASYLCRIQVRSDRFPYLDGAWFRAFDFRRWDYWSSSADAGWGAWCAETGWGAAWITAVLGLRHRRTSLWDRAADSRIGSVMDAVQAEMACNEGEPFEQVPLASG